MNRRQLAADIAAGTVPLKVALDHYPAAIRTACLKAMADPRLVSGDIGEYDTVTLLDVLYAPAQRPELRGFWLRFFPRVLTSDSQEIRFDTADLNEYRLAPFVAPNVQGRTLRSKGFNVKSFRPAYLKPKHVVDPTRAIPRRPGERPGGELSLQQRFDAIVADNMRVERLVIENRWDWMACQAIVNGSVLVVGEDYPAVTVDFGRDASLSYTLAGAAKWDQSTATVLPDIGAARRNAFTRGNAPITTLVFGLDAYAAFSQANHTDVQALLDRQRLNNTSNFNGTGMTGGEPYEYQGKFSGFDGGSILDFWTYNNQYEDSAGAMQPYLDQGTVVGVGGAINGMQCFGAIMDKGAQLQPVPMFPKAWDQEDPSASFTMTQSAPLMVPINPNNTFKIKVV